MSTFRRPFVFDKFIIWCSKKILSDFLLSLNIYRDNKIYFLILPDKSLKEISPSYVLDFQYRECFKIQQFTVKNFLHYFKNIFFCLHKPILHRLVSNDVSVWQQRRKKSHELIKLEFVFRIFDEKNNLLDRIFKVAKLFK